MHSRKPQRRPSSRAERRVRFAIVVAAGAWLAALQPAVAAEPAQVFREHCAACHGADRLGGTGPALLPENLERLRKPEALKVIREGRAATQMSGFADRLAADDIRSSPTGSTRR